MTDTVQLYTKLPVTIAAIQYTGDNILNVLRFAPSIERSEDQVLRIPTLEGIMQAQIGDWIIRGVQGEFYPCKPDIFSKTYQLA